MTTETIAVVNAQAASETAVPVVGAAQSSPQFELQIWTAVTAGPTTEKPPGTPALVVIDGVNCALRARIYEDADGVAVADIETGVFGAGESLREAVQDLHTALRDHLDVLAVEDALSPDLQRQLETLTSYFTSP